MAKFNLSEDYLNKSADTVAGTPREQTPVRYAVTCRRGGLMCGVADLIDLLTDHCNGPVTLRGKTDGESFTAGEVVLALEGPFGELVPLETLCGGILSLSAAAANMAERVEAAGDSIRLIDASARRYPPELTGPIAIAAAVGGARGTHTQAGQTAVSERFGVGGDQIRVGSRPPVSFGLFGSVPRVLEVMYGGETLEAADALHKACSYTSLTVRVGGEGRERDLLTEAVRRFGSALESVRLDTPADRIHQGGHEIPTRTLEMRILSQATDRAAAQAALERFGFGPGVTIEMAYAVRDLLDSLGGRYTTITVGDGFDVEKIRAWRICNAPVDYIEVDDWVDFGEFACELVAVQEEGQWVARRPPGRPAKWILPEDLPVIFQR